MEKYKVEVDGKIFDVEIKEIMDKDESDGNCCHNKDSILSAEKKDKNK